MQDQDLKTQAQGLASTWGQQVVAGLLTSKKANAAAGGGLAVMLIPSLMDYLHVASGAAPTTAQIVVGLMAVAYIVAQGLADHGKEAVLLDIRKNIMLAFTSGDFDAEKTKAIHGFIENGDLKTLLNLVEAQSAKNSTVEPAKAEDPPKA